MNIKDKLLGIGVLEDAIEPTITLFHRIVKIDDSNINDGGGCYLTYQWLETHFQSTKQGWSKLKEILRDSNNVLICDYIYSFGNEDKKDNKSYVYKLSDEWHEIVQQSLLLIVFKNEEYKNIKIWNVTPKSLKERLRRTVLRDIETIDNNTNPTIYPSSFRASKGGQYYNKSMFSSFIDFSVGVSFTKETEMIIRRKQNALQFLEGKARESLMSSITTDLICLKQIRSGEMKFELSKDGRWHQNGWIGLSTEVKKTLECNGMKHSACLDIRSCHGTFWGLYVKSTDASVDLSEVLRWNAIFLGEEKPVVYFQRKMMNFLTRKPSLKLVKDVLNKYFNGFGRDHSTNELRINKGEEDDSKNTLRALEYVISEEFPSLIAAWKKTNIKETGINISRFFEQKIMQDGRLFELAKEMGVVIVQEHDGFSVFSKEDIDFSPISNLMSAISDELFAIKIRVVNKGSIDRNGFQYFQSDEEILTSKRNEISSLYIALGAINKTLQKLGGKYRILKDSGDIQNVQKSWGVYQEIVKQKESKLKITDKIEKLEYELQENSL